ncbi:aconitase/3-isopropylmalate dehydratase large subunit family protein [Candidatus Cyanaurora vandensis]|uniref:3-isopropylmalate dehydratase large subunit n=1 Tax=Candidatus Cyanaurora vandensis TaxID=2714958 RepID=UPI00257C4C58|nr:aconitase/3-isopropylmalate dehydratase large subunit family protein [Candidatus Cyanaurora vandensis]
MAQTITQKILAQHSNRPRVEPGDNIWVAVDVLMTHDVCGPGTIGIFKKEFGADAKVWDTEKVVIIPDHYIFTQDRRANRNVDILREFVREQGIRYFYDVMDDPQGSWQFDPQQTKPYGSKYAGVCHLALAQQGHTRPGEVLVGTDSHTCNAGAFGQFATGIGNTDAAFVLGTGRILLKVPETMRFDFTGEIPPYLLAKDLILWVIGDISVSGATYRTLEFGGEAVSRMSMEERMTLTNMVIEAGGKNGVIPADETTFNYVNQRTTKPYQVFHSDPDADYVFTKTYDTSLLEPVVARPHSPDNRALARECSDVKIDRAYIGSCTGGKIEDFIHAAKLLKGQAVRVPTYLVPATREVYDGLFTEMIDGKLLADIFFESGCLDPADPSCAACLGGPQDTFGRLNNAEVCISTTNRNFPGRMGDKRAQVYLASPYTVAASAIRGYVTDPREFLA